MLTNMSMTVTCQCLMSIPKSALGLDAPTTSQLGLGAQIEITRRAAVHSRGSNVMEEVFSRSEWTRHCFSNHHRTYLKPRINHHSSSVYQKFRYP